MRKRVFLIVLLLVSVSIGYYGVKALTSNSQNKSLDSKQVVENYFKYRNEKNKKEILKTLTKWHDAPNVVWGFENLDNIKIVDIKEENSKDVRNGYLQNGRGSVNNTTENNLKVYKVKYEVKYLKDGVGPQDSGVYDWWFFVIRENENSPWLIDDMGE
ncbi:DUF4829 domain-containing protein [Clostridium paridis]|uniref:DUF4829 domain-containing protein n=1 Tax=Clostridium paridis TaxID=2803863 RepID=A0A937FGZ9_9CLOT|nr:DUF4829 domain-containing protein [Clostridium paridis]MBL4931863.1 DUF4829 domain-containing protein [Clostridium paridis]